MTVHEDGSADETAVAWCLRLDDGALLPAERAQLRDWLSQDPSHRARMERAVALWEGLEQDAHAPELLALRRQALAAVQRAGARRWSGAPIRRWPWVAVAAAAMVLLVAGLTFVMNRPQHYTTRIGEQRTVALNDGSTMVLDADSAVTVRFSDDRRDLTLERGRASFKVARNPLRPFAVASGRHVVVATGTAFSVERLSGEMRVALYEGHVAVLRDVPGGHAIQLARLGDVREAAEQALTPGHELVVADDQPLGTLRVAAASDTLGGGQLSFTDEPLATAVERVNRYSVARRIEVGAGTSAVRVSGVFNAGDADAFARGVAAAFPIRAASRGDHILLLPRPAAK